MSELTEMVELESGHTFRLRSVHDLFRKLHRELRRFEAAGDNRGDLIDAAINFSWTAWHLVEWLWLQREARYREEGFDSLGAFRKYVIGRCPHLAVFEVIANAAKHGGTAESRSDRPDVTTILVAGPMERRGSSEDIVIAMMERTWTLAVRYGGKTHKAGVMFRQAYLELHRLVSHTSFGVI